jgi:oxygen-independent coproporphyrinogen-3 oxidase
MSDFAALARKYDVPAPRYTSYPTVPFWGAAPDPGQWIDSVRRSLRDGGPRGWSCYVHIPFCETLCTFCGCNTSITRSHGVEVPYVEQLLREWETYRRAVPELEESPLRALHLGGGTPTFLSPDSLEALLRPLLGSTRRVEGFEGSIEVDPRRTTPAHLERLRSLGFGRVSLGVQDLDAQVQHIINRHQTPEQTLAITAAARELGYTSINWDLIYGLPLQTLERMSRTVETTLRARPDRIALYSFALVPWIKPAQRSFQESDLPVGEEKRALYEHARALLLAGGYVEIGMDHFALPEEGLSRAQAQGRLHRNFMGYVDQRTDLLLGLGVSAISETPDCFHQNEKVLNVYARRVGAGEVPTGRGHVLDADDRVARERVLQLMTRWHVELDPEEAGIVRGLLGEMVSDGLVHFDGDRLEVLPAGRPFLRNACMALDRRMRRRDERVRVFSQSL